MISPIHQDSKLNVLFITRKWPPAIGGMETYSYELVKALKHEEVAIDTIFLPGKEDGNPPSLFSLLGFIIKVAFQLIQTRNKYSVIHIGDFVLAPLGLLARVVNKKSKVFIMIHGLDILYGNRSGLLPAIYKYYQKILSKLKCADHFIVNSENTGVLCKEANLSPLTVIPLGVNTHLPKITSNKQNNNILFLGRLVTRKGAAWFAQNVLPKLDDSFKLIVVGKTWDKSEEDSLKTCENVELVGYASNELLEKIKKDSLLAVMPNQPSKNQTDVEGFGLVAAEIAVQGMPLIASNIEGLTSAVIDGKTGYLLAHNDIDAWCSKITEISAWNETKRTEYEELCRQTAKSYYSWQRVANETITLYKSMIQNDNK